MRSTRKSPGEPAMPSGDARGLGAARSSGQGDGAEGAAERGAAGERTASEGGATHAATAPDVSRRKFLTGSAAAAGVAAIGFPMVATAATTTLRFQSAWPTRDIFHEYALDFAKKVQEMSGGRLRIEVLPGGAVVKPFEMLDAVSKGVLDGGHGVSAYAYAKNTAYSLFGTGPSFGMDANMLLGWYKYGGGRLLYEELTELMKLDVVGFHYGPMPTQPLGWFDKEVKSVADLRRLKYRTVGLAMDVFRAMGLSVTALPAAEIVPAMDRGLLDAAEFNNASSDRLLGVPDVAKVCMLQSYHQPLECFEILINRSKYNRLATDLKSIIEYAADASSADMSWKAMDRYSADYDEMASDKKIKFRKTPKSVLKAQLAAWDKVVAAKSAENPLFARIIDSQKKWAARVVKWSENTTVPNDLAYHHYFSKK